ncbi:MAG: T9SS type A sorting domain-containing protein [Ferruginibacter sp.]
MDWQTANEQNVSHFEIQRSTDGNTFIEIGRVVAKNQSSNTYSTPDNISSLSNYSQLFYRIKQIDTDGKFTFSKIEVVNIKEELIPSIYPNPVNEILRVTNSGSIKNIQLTDMLGSKLKSWTTSFSLLYMNEVQAGIYVVEITLHSGKVIKEKIIKL